MKLTIDTTLGRKEIKDGIRCLRLLLPPIPKPGPLTGQFSQESESMKLSIPLPVFDVNREDVHDREMVTVIDAVETNRERLGIAPDASPTYVVDGISQGQNVKCTLRNVDDGDPPNFSEPSVFEGVANVSGAADTVAPAKPGELTGTFTE